MHNKRPPSSDRSRHLAITRSRCCHRFCLFLSWFPPSPSDGLLGRESCPVTVAPQGCCWREASVCRPDHKAGQDPPGTELLRDRNKPGKKQAVKPAGAKEAAPGAHHRWKATEKAGSIYLGRFVVQSRFKPWWRSMFKRPFWGTRLTCVFLDTKWPTRASELTTTTTKTIVTEGATHTHSHPSWADMTQKLEREEPPAHTHTHCVGKREKLKARRKVN